uniref:Uncharacterized protein n=1 Tax=Schistocephalus solidus TaxID=70667 RepID=A0A0X3NUS5_SCHSO
MSSWLSIALKTQGIKTPRSKPKLSKTRVGYGSLRVAKSQKWPLQRPLSLQVSLSTRALVIMRLRVSVSCCFTGHALTAGYTSSSSILTTTTAFGYLVESVAIYKTTELNT